MDAQIKKENKGFRALRNKKRSVRIDTTILARRGEVWKKTYLHGL